jgi:hypothetical protein
MDEIMANTETKPKSAKPKPQNRNLSPDLKELLHMMASLEKQSATAKA